MGIIKIGFISWQGIYFAVSALAIATIIGSCASSGSGGTDFPDGLRGQKDTKGSVPNDCRTLVRVPDVISDTNETEMISSDQPETPIRLSLYVVKGLYKAKGNQDNEMLFMPHLDPVPVEQISTDLLDLWAYRKDIVFATLEQEIPPGAYKLNPAFVKWMSGRIDRFGEDWRDSIVFELDRDFIYDQFPGSNFRWHIERTSLSSNSPYLSPDKQLSANQILDYFGVNHTGDYYGTIWKLVLRFEDSDSQAQELQWTFAMGS